MTYMLLTCLLDTMRTQRQRLVRSYRDGGYSTETVLVSALLVLLAIGVIGVLASKLRAKADSIDLDGTAP